MTNLKTLSDPHLSLPPVSVVLAACNGARYLQQQMASILSQLSGQDELIVSLDPSTDESRTIIESFQDERIVLLEGPGKGAVRNFENGLQQVRNPIVFLSDQDDVWLPGKKETILKLFDDPELMAVCHDAAVCDADLQVTVPSFFALHHSKNGQLANFVRNSWMGCCMAFRKEVLDAALPFPASLPMHDQWIGLMAGRLGATQFVPQVLLNYRRHGSNVSSLHPSSLLQQAAWRFHLLRALASRPYAKNQKRQKS